jgi:hypothetical protein
MFPFFNIILIIIEGVGAKSLLSIGSLLYCDWLALDSRLYTQPLLNVGWMIACYWLALGSLWVVPTRAFGLFL